MALRRTGSNWQIDYYENGRRVRLRFPTKELANQALRQLQARKYTAPYGLVSGNVPLSEAITQFLTHTGAFCKPSTCRGYRQELIAFQKWTGNDPALSSIHHPLIESYQVQMRNTRKEVSTDTAIRALSVFFNWAKKNLLIAENPCAHIKRLNNARPRIEFFAKEEVDHILEHADKYRDIIYFLIETGLRAGEFCNLRIADVKDGFIEVPVRESWSPKSSKARIIPLRPTCAEMLKKYTSRDGEAPLFLNPSGRKWTPTHLHHMLSRLGKRIGVKNSLHPHKLRKTFGSHFLMSGGDMRTLQKILGHSDISITMRTYADVTDQHMRLAINGLPW